MKVGIELGWCETKRMDLESELIRVKHDRDHFKKTSKENLDFYWKAVEEKRELEERIRKAVTKALHPDWPSSEDEEDEEEDNSPSPSFAE